jgi:hypothetical protein
MVERMSRFKAIAVVLGFLSGIVIACGDNNATATGANGEDSDDLGCCPDIQTGCTLYAYGKKTKDNPSCIVGRDGVVPDPNQPGWTHGKDENGCPYWAPPPNAKMIECGRAK